MFIPLMAALAALPWYIFIYYFGLQTPVLKIWEISTEPIFQKSEVNFLAMGDIMLSRSVGDKIQKANDPFLPFSQLSSLLESVDFSFANLETPIVPTNNMWVPGSLIFSTPESYAVGFKSIIFLSSIWPIIMLMIKVNNDCFILWNISKNSEYSMFDLVQISRKPGNQSYKKKMVSKYVL